MSKQVDDAIFGQVRDILTANFNIPAERITPQATFRGHFGMDSLDIVDLVFFLQKTFGVSADLESYRELHSMQKLVRFIRERTAEKAAEDP